MMKLDILVFGAHPDDAELGAGATIAKCVAQGKKVGIIDLTMGELGTRGTPEIRAIEAQNAAKILGVSLRKNLEMKDGFFQNTPQNQIKIIKVIRKYRPDIVLANAIDDRHIDHAKGAKLVSDAVFLSGLRRIETTESNGEAQMEWRPKKLYHYIQWKNLKPDFVMDVTDYIDLKINAIKAFKSQFYDPTSKEPETPISSKNFIDSVTYRARDLGRLVGVEFAEGFTCNHCLAVNDLDSFI